MMLNLIPDLVELTISICGLLSVLFFILALASKQEKKRKSYAVICFFSSLGILIAFIVSLIIGAPIIMTYYT
ncbi:MAG: hypothetical protein ACXQS8_02565 [Candidatus Helarchaeales archaeon]